MNRQQQSRSNTEPPSKSERWGPEIYLHVEFRMSWGGKKNQQQQPKSHQLTYRSRALRDRAPNFPRQVPAPNTNYLEAIHQFEQSQSRRRAAQAQLQPSSNPFRYHQLQEYYRPLPPPQPQQQQHHQIQPQHHQQVPIIREPQPRQTRADARPGASAAHERGRSAPPPIGENPWDVTTPYLPPAAPAPPCLPAASQSDLSELARRKPLPAPPEKFRLGEGRQPWSTWSVPEGFDLSNFDYHDDDGEEEEVVRPATAGAAAAPASQRRRRRRGSSSSVVEQGMVMGLEGSLAPPPRDHVDRNSAAFVTSPSMVSTFSPEPSAGAGRREVGGPAEAGQEGEGGTGTTTTTRDLETGRARDLGALSAAMMTVDNGFEGQWWFRGGRESVLDMKLGGTTDSRRGDAGQEEEEEEEEDDRPPMSATAGPMDEHTPMPVALPVPEREERGRTDDGLLRPISGLGERSGGSGGSGGLASGMVSPLTEDARSPELLPAVPALTRSWSTRSEELWFRERWGR
ncbi:hypothetical protein VTJ04DRAFT_10744 [Mycothermus thermophilus]|uniref:uncharacterized protein n=1 Tax=Humicola insolens TaxID=85995 RepID=UPI003743DF0B